MDQILSLRAMQRRRAALRASGQRVVFTNGCFDVIHAGHVKLLQRARSFGDVLVLGLNSDASTRRLKGRGRPIVPAKDRAAVLAALACVDYVVFFDEDTPEAIIRALQPDVLVKGGDYRIDQIVGADFVRAAGGSVRRVRLLRGRSTSAMLRRILAL